MSKIIPLIARCSRGQRNYGVDFGGQFLYRYFLETNCKFSNMIEVENKAFNDYTKGLEEIKNKTSSIFKNKQVPLVLGGDHIISYGSIKAALNHFNNNIHVLWFDSHADINSLKESKTKNRHGMVVSSLMDINDEVWGSNDQVLQPGQITYIGLNDVDPYEEKVINELNINYIHRDEIHKKSFHDMVPDNIPLYVTLDVDVIDKQFVSCTGTPVDRGFEPELISFILNHFKGQIIGMDVVEYNPFLGSVDDNKLSMFSIKNSIEPFLKYNEILEEDECI